MIKNDEKITVELTKDEIKKIANYIEMIFPDEEELLKKLRNIIDVVGKHDCTTCTHHDYQQIHQCDDHYWINIIFSDCISHFNMSISQNSTTDHWNPFISRVEG